MNPESIARLIDEREARIFAEIDKLIVPSGEIDQYEQDAFGDQVQPANHWRADLIEMLLNPQVAKGYRLPWPGLDKFRMRPGELTIWSGYNGHGKSLVLTQAMLGLMNQGAKTLIASLELHPKETLKRMACQSTGVPWDEITKLAIEQFFDKMDGYLSLYTEVGDIEPHRVVALCRYAEAMGVEHLVIDSLMKCGILDGDYAAEKKFVNTLQNIAKNTGLHIHLVAHSKKAKDEYEMPGKFDVSGSTMITNIADNVMTASRNKKKELEKVKPEQDRDLKIMQKADAYLNCCKQRHGNWEGIVGLWFHESGQFMSKENQRMRLL